MTVRTASSLLSILGRDAVVLRVRWPAREGRDDATVQGNAYRIRTIELWILVPVWLPTTAWLFRENPYAAPAAAAQGVNVTGNRWYWYLDRTEVAAGQPVEFRVTSVDANHGLGIYDESGALVAQSRAMPFLVNRLTHVFETPGTYRVLCLECCGLADHDLAAEIVVAEGGEVNRGMVSVRRHRPTRALAVRRISVMSVRRRWSASKAAFCRAVQRTWSRWPLSVSSSPVTTPFS